MGRRFEGSPVVAGSQRDRVNAIHNAFVVGCSPVGINQGQIVCQDDTVAHLLTRIPLTLKVLHGNADPCFGDSSVGEVGKDAQEHLAAGDGFDQRGNTLAHGIHQIGAHGIAGVDMKMQHHHVATIFGCDVVKYFYAPGTAATGNHLGVQRVRKIYNFGFCRQQSADCCLWVVDVNGLHLTYKNRFAGGCAVAPTQTGDASST